MSSVTFDYPRYKSLLPEEIGTAMVKSAWMSAALGLLTVGGTKAALTASAMAATATLVHALLRPFFSSLYNSKNGLKWFLGHAITASIAVSTTRILSLSVAPMAIGLINAKPLPDLVRILAMLAINTPPSLTAAYAHIF